MVNTAEPAVRKVTADATSALESKLTPLRSEIESLNAEIADAQKAKEEKKEDAKDTSEQQKKVAELREKVDTAIRNYAATQPEIKQIIDLALLQSNLLKGESLSEFIRRSVSMLPK